METKKKIKLSFQLVHSCICRTFLNSVLGNWRNENIFTHFYAKFVSIFDPFRIWVTASCILFCNGPVDISLSVNYLRIYLIFKNN